MFYESEMDHDVAEETNNVLRVRNGPRRHGSKQKCFTSPKWTTTPRKKPIMFYESEMDHDVAEETNNVLRVRNGPRRRGRNQ